MRYNGINYDIKWYSNVAFNNLSNNIPYSNPNKDTLFVNKDDCGQYFHRGNNKPTGNVKEALENTLNKSLNEYSIILLSFM
jgi:hypothetical protein